MAKGGKAEVVVKDHGLDQMFEKMREIQSSYVKVGVLGDTAEGGLHVEGGDLTEAEIASVLEFGTEDGKIPARPFVRTTYDRELPRLVQLGQVLMGKVIDNKLSVKEALDIMGSSLASKIKAYVVQGVPPPNAPSTIMAKLRRGRTAKLFRRGARTIGQALAQVGAAAAVKPLIDTGRMLGAITWAVVTGGKSEE